MANFIRINSISGTDRIVNLDQVCSIFVQKKDAITYKLTISYTNEYRAIVEVTGRQWFELEKALGINPKE